MDRIGIGVGMGWTGAWLWRLVMVLGIARYDGPRNGHGWLGG